MTMRFLARLIALAFMLGVLAFVSRVPVQASANRNACTKCRRACFLDYQQCLQLGEFGCDLVLSDCESGCPCP